MARRAARRAAREDPAVARAAAIAAIGLRADAATDDADAVVGATHDPDARVRAAAVATLVRAGSRAAALPAWSEALDDASAAVRRRAAELGPVLATRAAPDELVAQMVGGLVARLADPDATVVEAAAWALGELGSTAVGGDAVRALASVATAHDDPLAREAAVAALGALGDPDGLDAILTACRDKPAVRRRAVLALAPFEGAAVDAALAAAREDRDWQVRQAAEDLLDPRPD